ncbi:MAG: PEP-CTERM sorting domain-containing protein [Nitrososphaerales archaeon]
MSSVSLIMLFFLTFFLGRPQVANATYNSNLSVVETSPYLSFSFELPNFGGFPAPVSNLIINGVSEITNNFLIPQAGLIFPCNSCNTGMFYINFLSPSGGGVTNSLTVNSGDVQEGGIDSQGLIYLFDDASSFDHSYTISVISCLGSCNGNGVFGNMTISPSATPEPSAWLLFGTGVLFIGFLGLRKRNVLVNKA